MNACAGGAGVEAAANWLMEHENDADLDTPLMVTQVSFHVCVYNRGGLELPHLS